MPTPTAPPEPKLRRQITHFILIGLCCYLTVMALLLLLVEVIGMGVNTANVLASALVMGLNYLLTITFVFERGRHAPWKEVAGFFVFAILGYLLNIWLMYLLTAQVPIHYTLAKTLVVGGVAGFNFVTRKFFIFKG